MELSVLRGPSACRLPSIQELQVLRSRPSVAAEVEEARKKGYQKGVSDGKKEAGQGAPEKVKKIMNQTFQTLSAQLKSKPSFTSKEVQTLVLATIRVRGCVTVVPGGEGG